MDTSGNDRTIAEKGYFSRLVGNDSMCTVGGIISTPVPLTTMQTVCGEKFRHQETARHIVNRGISSPRVWTSSVQPFYSTVRKLAAGMMLYRVWANCGDAAHIWVWRVGPPNPAGAYRASAISVPEDLSFGPGVLRFAQTRPRLTAPWG